MRKLTLLLVLIALVCLLVIPSVANASESMWSSWLDLHASKNHGTVEATITSPDGLVKDATVLFGFYKDGNQIDTAYAVAKHTTYKVTFTNSGTGNYEIRILNISSPTHTWDVGASWLSVGYQVINLHGK